MIKNTPIITNIETLLSIIDMVKKDCPDRTLFFRGQNKRYPNVTPSIDRNNYIKSEDILFREYILRNPDEFTGEKTTFEKLVKMQHYKLPTRLLDITSNPLIALFFAVEYSEDCEYEKGDFIIYAIPEDKIKYYDSDTISVVSNIARRPFNALDLRDLTQSEAEPDEKFIKRFNESDPIKYLLHEIKEEKPYFENVIKKDHLEDIWCVKPLLKNRRIIKQDGAFLLFGMHQTKEKLASYKSFEPTRFEVGEKANIRMTLELLGVSKDKIYPELDTTAEYLRELYKNK